MNQFDFREIETYSQLLVTLNSNEIEYNYALIEEAYNFAASIHANQNRLDGKPYESHILTVANYIAQLKLDDISVASALLHDIVEKGNIDIEEIDKRFGTEISFIVDGLTDIRKLSKNLDASNQKGDEFRNLFFNSTDDIRIIIIRLAEKTHNILTLAGVEDKVKKISAKKILNIYAPIASYLGLGVIQSELQDTAFKILNEKEYQIIKNDIEDVESKTENLLERFESEIKQLLDEYNFNYIHFYGRRKGIYSTYKKVKNKLQKNVELKPGLVTELNDVFAFRLIVDTLEKCYLGLGLVHSKFNYSQDLFKDYISKPKENGYKSLHTILEFENNLVEVQIRTQEMHEYNEFGPASHIAYKLLGSSKKSDNTFTWTKDLVGWKSKSKLTKEDFKVKAFEDSIFVFTPKGLVIKLNKGAMPLDFAFAIHTNVGTNYVGALVNGKMVSMNFELKTGDVVEIKTSKKPNITSDWLNFCTSPSSKYRIRKWMRQR